MEEVEIGKADQYWPEHGQTREYGTMQVTNIREEKIKDTPWIRRSLIIEQLNNRPRGQEDDSGEKRELILIHVTDWIDFGAFDAHSLATLVLEVDSIIAQSRQDTKVTKEGGICDQAHADRPCIMVHCRYTIDSYLNASTVITFSSVQVSAVQVLLSEHIVYITRYQCGRKRNCKGSYLRQSLRCGIVA